MEATSNGGSDLLTELVVDVGDLVPPDVGGSLVVQCFDSEEGTRVRFRGSSGGLSCTAVKNRGYNLEDLKRRTRIQCAHHRWFRSSVLAWLGTKDWGSHSTFTMSERDVHLPSPVVELIPSKVKNYLCTSKENQHLGVTILTICSIKTVTAIAFIWTAKLSRPRVSIILDDAKFFLLQGRISVVDIIGFTGSEMIYLIVSTLLPCSSSLRSEVCVFCCQTDEIQA
ncbi:hypothetical protein RHMOL_Rhmol06G0308800 [Rhododendron molle]|uniref:Uncharacterized protein n=1 Tax=Rhododendron molle TaxID=49168 RepID=A0ACC0NJB6_RHOML|nr:hypothetical protein RHMOL_Rhmol06G0308800 [Rhododendron molle]